MSALTSEYLPCPTCREWDPEGPYFVHLTGIVVEGRVREDAVPTYTAVNSAGEVTQGDAVTTRPFQPGGRRNSFALRAWCEGCRGRFAIEFRQQKGVTEISYHTNIA